MSSLEIQPLITNARSSASDTSVSGRGGMQTPTAPAAQPKIDTVWKACAYGDFETLRSLLGQDPSLVQRGDEQGYFPLQWAALNNRVGIINYLLETGAPINLADHTGQTALHWAAVRGSLSAAETLLRSGADLSLQDGKGYTVCHVAAQYGQTAFLYHVALRWGADLDILDNDQRSPLHWAAYKGYADTIRLLMVMDGNMTLADHEGCTPLHWAAIRGNGEACTLLLQGGAQSLLTARDVTGSTPAQLALSKGHRALGLHLADWRRRHEHSSKGPLSFLFNTQLCPIIWTFIIVMLGMFVHRIMRHPGLVPLRYNPTFVAWIAVCLALSGLVLLFKTTTADPGFIPCGDSAHGTVSQGRKASPATSASRHGERYNHYKQLDSPALWAGAWNQLCVTCKVVRPLRAKHCSVSDRCVRQFDHFCPWVGNCIGQGNRHLFLAFLWVELTAMVLVAAVAALRLHHIAKHEGPATHRAVPWVVCFLVVDLIVGGSVAALAITQASQVARNVTTNELANWSRYKYLRDHEGAFQNPFDRGCKQNCLDAWNPTQASPAPYVLQEDSGSKMSLLKMEQGQAAVQDWDSDA